MIQGNFIGLTPGGLYAGGYGAGAVVVSGAGGNQIGGTSAAARNVIGSNNADIAITGPNNSVQGNYLNSDLSGTKAQTPPEYCVWHRLDRRNEHDDRRNQDRCG